MARLVWSRRRASASDFINDCNWNMMSGLPSESVRPGMRPRIA